MATIGRYYLNACSVAAKERNIKTESLMSLAGIVPTTAKNTQQRINDASMVLFLNAIAKSTDDAFLGFAKPPVPLSFFSYLLQGLYYCNTVEQAIKTLASGLKLVNCELAYYQKEQCTYITLEHQHNDPQHFLLEYLMVFIHRILSWLSTKAIKLDFAQINYQPDHYQQEFTLLFRCPTKFNQATNALVFSTRYLSLPILRNRSEFSILIEQFPMMVLRYPGEENALHHKVLQLLSTHYLKNKALLKATEVANKLNMSSATLRRKLADLTTSFGEIKADFLKTQAIQLLQHPKNTTEAIASELGYSEARAFSRVFKQWTNLTPSQYRKLL